MPIMNLLITIIVFLIICVIIRLISKSNITWDPRKRAGNAGEHFAKELFSTILKEEDLLVTNIELEYEGKETEIDDLIVTRKGIFIVEVKNFVGSLSGDIEDNEWIKTKVSYEDTFDKTIRNPIKQVNREVYILSKKLKEKGIYVWIEGAVFLVNDNPGIYDSKLLRDVNEVNSFIHPRGKESLSNRDFEYIKKVVKELNEI